MRIARAAEKDGSAGSAVGSVVGVDVGSAAVVLGAAEGVVGSAGARDEASPVHPVTRSATVAMPTYPRMARP